MFRDLKREEMGVVDDFGGVWSARIVVDVVLGICLMAVEMAKGRRRTNAMVAVEFVSDLRVE